MTLIYKDHRAMIKDDLTSPVYLLKILDSSLNGIMVFEALRDSSSEITDFEWKLVNNVASKMLGCHDGVLMGKKLLKEMPENLHQGIFENYVKVVESGASKTFQVHYQGHGVDTWFHIEAAKLGDGVVVNFFDISDMKETEEELTRKERLLTEAQNLAKLGSWSWDVAQNKVEWSENVYNIHEISDLSFQPSYEFFINSILEEDRGRVEKTINRAIELARPYEITFRAKSKSGIKHLHSRAVPKLKEDNSVQGYLGIVRDITLETLQQEELKKAEQRLYRIEKAARSERMARSIAHEIRNPLTNISLAGEQLRSEPDEDSRNLFLDMITRNTARIDSLIKELMDSTKPAALEYGTHDINTILDKAVGLAMDRVQLRDITIEKKYARDMCDIKVDQEKLKIALLNIIINAIEAVKDKTGKILLETELTEEECLVRISDNGEGISPEELNNLFDPFFTGKKSGMGLGLTTTLNIINGHDGDIEVKSELELGTTFTVSLKREN